MASALHSTALLLLLLLLLLWLFAWAFGTDRNAPLVTATGDWPGLHCTLPSCERHVTPHTQVDEDEQHAAAKSARGTAAVTVAQARSTQRTRRGECRSLQTRAEDATHTAVK